MASPTPRKTTNQFMRQGHTSTPVYGNDPQINAKGKPADTPKEIKP